MTEAATVKAKEQLRAMLMASERKDAMDNREPGFYWVRIHDEDWDVAEWADGAWWLAGADEYWREDELKEIDERRIIRPPE